MFTAFAIGHHFAISWHLRFFSRARENAARCLDLVEPDVVGNVERKRLDDLVDQDLIMKEVRKTADRIAGRLNMNKILKLRWPVE